MAKIKGLSIKFKQSESPDVVTNKLYLVEMPGPVTYESTSYDIGNTPDVNGMIVVDLATIVPNVDGIFNLGVAAVDDAGNESEMSKVDNVPLDFVAPLPPGAIFII
jgi:hypothetical protein